MHIQNFILTLSLVCLISSSCRQHDSAQASNTPRVFMDVKTREQFVTISSPLDIPRNPHTGKPTLAATLYCSKCKQWHPVPPIEILLRNPQARLCRKTKTPLTMAGPIPDSAIEIPQDKESHHDH